ncbi:DNA-3-methyladenine glycosylase [Salinicoccus bachuensis]|uniref:Putative 3-methyladenine DNA glycosylase n=1 Tax=Salinicoccus bachuensis TaxID=3136731 RepID=A0ABZ3CI53_9STAP
MADTLDIKFLADDTLDAARKLLGVEIITCIDGVETSGFITEVEAYLGLDDRAAHTFGGKKNKKNSMMFNDYGHIYVYTMHGHHCMNILTKEKAYPEGILIRGIEPHVGRETMIERRGRETGLTDGPGKLTKSLGIRRELHNGMELNNGILTLKPGRVPLEIEETKRIGIDNKKEAVDYPYRFIVKGNPHVSRFRGRPADNNGWK